MSLKVAVIGETCLDRFIYGKVNRICPEAPVPVLEPIEEHRNLGMATNVYENLLSICRSKKEKWSITLITNSPKGSKTRYIDKDSNQMFLRIDDDHYTHINKKPLVDLSIYDAVIVSDYNKGYLQEEDLSEIGKKSTFSIIDTKKFFNPAWFDNFDFVKINEKEARENGFYKNWEKAENKTIITKSSKGCSFRGENYKIHKPSEVRDVCGAGDTFLAAFSCEYLLTKSLEKSFEFAQNCCQKVISKKGVVSP